MEIDPARLGIEGHVNDLPGSRKPERNGKQLQWVTIQLLQLGHWGLPLEG